MNVLILSTYDLNGGAAIAAHRLAEALNNNGVKTKMMVLSRKSQSPYVIPVGNDTANKWRKALERLTICCAHKGSRKQLFATSIANTGYDVTETQAFKEADIIHIHWTCQGMLSLKGINKILQTGKPVVWTMHDMWALTAICHYTRGCTQAQTACTKCPQEDLHQPFYRFAKKCWQRKKEIYNNAHALRFVTCSKWLAQQAEKSALIGRHQVVSIPNTINTHLFRKQDKQLARRRLNLPDDKQLILFVAQSVSDPRKGMHHLTAALNKLCEVNPQTKNNTEVVLLGGKADNLITQLPLKTHCLGYLAQANDIINAYNAADIFVLPSTEDNLPNTIMEAMACGVPCVGFNIGGIPEMIDHLKSGYVAHADFDNGSVQVDTDDMAAGLQWMLYEANRTQLSANALEKVHTTYAHQHVAGLYIQQYEQLLLEQ